MYSFFNSAKVYKLAIVGFLAASKLYEGTIEKAHQAIEYLNKKNEEEPTPIFKIGKAEIYKRDLEVAGITCLAYVSVSAVLYLVYKIITWMTTPNQPIYV